MSKTRLYCPTFLESASSFLSHDIRREQQAPRDRALVVASPGTHWNLAASLLQARRRRHREVCSLARVTQLIGTEAGAGAEPRLCGSGGHRAPGGKMLCHQDFADGSRSPEALSFLLVVSRPELNLNPDPVSFPREPGGATPRTGLTLF